MRRSAGDAAQAGRGDRGGRGSVAVEFALTFGLLATLLLVTLDAGRMLNAQLVLTMAAREGARRAAIAGGDYPEVRAHMLELVEAGHLDVDRLELDIRPRRARYGTILHVDLAYRWEPQAPLLGTLLGSEVVLRARVVTRSERLAPRDES